MIKHIVAWNFDNENKRENIEMVKDLLESLPNKIPEILEFEVGVNLKKTEFSKDLVLISEFKDLAALRAYAEHPEHQKAVKIINYYVTDRVVVDFEI